MNDPDPPDDNRTPRERAILSMHKFQQERYAQALRSIKNPPKAEEPPNREPEKE